MHTESTFKGREGLELYYQSWLPSGKPKAILMLAHGYAEHSGRYTLMGEHFAGKGYGVYAVDHRGHGRSGGERVYVREFSDYVDDLKTFFDIIRKAHPDEKIFLVGHSMGSAIALLYASKHQAELAGLVTSGGGINKAGDPPQPRQPEGQPLPTDFLSRDPAVIEDYINDPLVFRGPIPARLAGMMGGIAEAVPNITLPALLMAGNDVSDGTRSENMFQVIGSKDKTLKLYDGLRHEIFNEPEKYTVFADLENWLKSHLS